ncbi:MAG: L-threonylcarbamoyladenylate synthase [Elusimicrobiota bacterium]|nr:L-threonylcarbamoyladenylate synthase [Elusimicrobiota bacterium]
MFPEEEFISGQIKKAAAIIEDGGVTLFPTDTVCGLFASPRKPKAVKKIYKIKKRDLSKPLAMLVPDIDSILEIVNKDSSLEKKLKENWPGAVTFILNTKDGETIGVRMPDFKPLLELLSMTGPLYATSANISGKPAPVKVSDVEEKVKSECDIVVHLDIKSKGNPSSVIDLTGAGEEVIRE